MDIKVNRGVLRFAKMNHITEKNLNVNKEAPQSFSSKYQREGCPCVLLKKGTLTVEAAFCATTFFLAFFSLLYLFELVFIQSRMEMTLARAVARYQTYGTKAGMIEMLYKEKAVIRWDDEQKICSVAIKQKISFIGSSWFKIYSYRQMKYHDYTGKSMVYEGDGTEEFVYITEHGRVYHKQQKCVYLYPGIQSVLYQNVYQKRNASGGKYGICKSCCRNVELTAGRMVYITTYGDCCHAIRSCSKLLRTPRKVPRKDVVDMPGCSKCVK